MENLLPCPFCGGKGKVICIGELHMTGMFYVVKCEQCGARAKMFDMPIFIASTADDSAKIKAIKAWNERK